MTWVVFAIPFAVGLGWLAVFIVGENLKLKKAKEVVGALPNGELERIRTLVEQIGTEPSRGYIGLIRGLDEVSGRLTVTLPPHLTDFPWCGRVVEVAATPGKEQPVQFSVHEVSAHGGTRDQFTLRWLAIPSIRVGQKKRVQNVFSLDRYIQQSPELPATLEQLHPQNPKLLLELILSVDGQPSSTEPFDQLRCGLPPAWIQSPRFHKCPTCRRPLRLILQVPGMLLGSRLAEGCFYLFGCPSHPDQTATDQDWG